MSADDNHARELAPEEEAKLPGFLISVAEHQCTESDAVQMAVSTWATACKDRPPGGIPLTKGSPQCESSFFWLR